MEMNTEKIKQISTIALLLLGLVGGATAVSKTYQVPGTIESGDEYHRTDADYTGLIFQLDGGTGTFDKANTYDYIESQGSSCVFGNYDTNTLIDTTTAGSNFIDFQDTELEYGTSYYVGCKDLVQETFDGTYPNIKVDNEIVFEYSFFNANDDLSSVTLGENDQNRNIYAVDIYNLNFNEIPVFNSTSVTPDPPLIGESVSYSAQVSDSDGSVSYTNLTVSYEGSQVVSDAQRTGNSPAWNNIFTPNSGNKWLNATLETVDDAGATTTQEINRYLSNDAPAVSISNLGNQTYLSYSRDVSILVSDSDSNPSEQLTCDLYLDGTQYNTRTVTEGSSFSTTIEADLGSHTFKASCSDPSGNTDSKTVDYSVDAAEIQSVYAADPVYETENRSFELDLKTGDMVNEADFDLVYSGGVEDASSMSSNGIETLRPNLYHEIPLVDSNQTSKNWRIDYSLNISDFQASTTSNIQESTSTQSQEVLWSYYIESADTNPANGKYIETEDLKHEVEIGTETKKAEVTGTTQYSRNSETDQMIVTENTTGSTILQGNIDVGLADSFNQSSFQTSSDIQIQFNGDTRTLSTGQDNVEVYRIQLFDQANPGGLTTSEALKFDVQYEETGAQVNTRLTMDLSVWKNQDEKIRRFNFKKDPASEHSFHIYPSWASYNIRTLPYPDQTKFDLIQYWNNDKDFVRRSYFFPTTQTINNQTTTVPLRTINRSEATKIDFELLTSQGNAAKNVYCRVDRKFGGGDFSTVFMIKTGSQGRGQSFAEVNEIYYSFTCYENGEVIETFPSQIMQNPMVLNLGQTEIETILDYQDTFDASCSYNETQISCDYQSQSEKMSEARLTVERLEPVNNVQVCQKTGSTITGELVCNGLNTSENDYSYSVEGVYPGGTITGISGRTGVDNSGLGAGGLILTMFIFLFTYAATSFNVPLGIAAGTFSLLISSAVGLWVLTPTMRAALIAVALIAGLVTRR